ncbi:MAG: hypothetical protein JJU11_08150 [Candidatus Sumerlaeia bacterium]|nr:hypothetical protein [Candidatus Sumerlaeia bacterium]
MRQAVSIADILRRGTSVFPPHQSDRERHQTIMSLHFFVQLDCIPREVLGDPDLIELLGRRDQAIRVAEEYRTGHGVEDIERMGYRMEVRAASEEKPRETREVTVAQMLRETAPLDELSGHCANCPVSINGEAFGCIQSIGLPIDKAGEEWLLGMINENSPEAVRMSARAFVPNPDHLGRLQTMRKSRFFESTTGVSRTVGEVTIQSDDILAEFFFREHWEPVELLAPLLLFDLVASEDGRRGDDLHSFLSAISQGEGREKLPGIVFSPNLEKHPLESDTSRDLLVMFLAQYLSLASGVPFRVWN